MVSPLTHCRCPDPLWVAYNGIHYDAVSSLERSSALVVPVAFPPESRTSRAVDLHLPDNPNLSSSSASPVDFAPASFSIASCNVTSLKKNFRLLDFADFIGLQESRHTLAAQPSLSAKLRSVGYQVLFGAPVGYRLRQKLWDSGRWLHALVPFGCGRRAIHIIVYYGFSGQYSQHGLLESNEALFSDVLAEASLYRDLPCVILTDLNRDPSESEACRQAVLRGGWLDCAAASNNLSSTHFPSHGTPRRLDAIFLNKTAAVCFHQYRVHDDSGIPSHHPIIAQIRLPALRALYAQLQKPKMLPSSAFTVTPDDDAIFLACWNSVSSDWSMHQSNPDELFAVFNRLVDQFLCARARIADARPFCHRGRFPVFKLQPAVATSRPVQHGGSQATCRERMLRKLARQIKSFLAQLPSLPSVWPYAIKQLHSKILHRAHILKFDVSNLQSACDSALAEADRLNSSAEASALDRWRQKIKLDFGSHKRETFKWLSRDYSSPQVFLKKDDCFTACPHDIDTLIRSVWEPVMNRSPVEPVPQWSDFLSHYSAFIPHVPPFSLRPITVPRLRAVINKMSKHSASGLDHWSVSCLHSLPDSLLDKLCDVYCCIESAQSWPVSLTAGYLCLIPKPDSDGSPASLRPLSILSVLYRAWASLRLSELMVWQESWCHPSQSGFRTLHSCLDAWYPLALRVERALLSGEDLAGCFLDFEKAFDLVPLHEIILPLAHHLGLPAFFVNTLSNLYGRLRRFLKHAKGFGSCISSNRGIVQGCPVSVVLLNLLVSVFLRVVEVQNSQASPQAYADDISASTTSVASLDLFLQQAGSFASVTGQRLKAKKSKLWSTCSKMQTDLSALRLGSVSLDSVLDIRYLGAQFGFHAGLPVVDWSHHFATFKRLVSRVACLPLSAAQKALIISAAPIPKILHGCELTALDLPSLTKLRTVVLRGLWRGRSGRVPEVLTSIIFPGHRCDPIQVCAFIAIRSLRALCLKAPHVRSLVRSVWDIRTFAEHVSNVRGPLDTALRALDLLGWSWVESFDTFHRPVFGPIHWLCCSRSWLLHEVRSALRQFQLSLAARRCAHLHGFSVFDKPSTVSLLVALQNSKHMYAAGTLKAILANAVRTAVLFHKAELAPSPVCPFCNHGVPETTGHMFDVCPAWSHIRDARNLDFSNLPRCTLLTGIACLPSLTVSFLQDLYGQLLVVRPPPLPAEFDLWPPDQAVIVYVAVAGLHTSHSIWKSFGYGVFVPSVPSGNFSQSLAGPDQCSLRAGLCGVLACCLRFAQPLVIRVFSSDISAWWQHDLPLSFCDGDHLDLKDLFRAHLPTRAFPVHLEFSHARDNASFFHAADQLAQLGAQMHQTPSFNTAYEDYLAHSQLVEARQQLLLDIVLERDKVAKSKKLLTYAKRNRCRISRNTQDNPDSPLSPLPDNDSISPSPDNLTDISYLVHPDNFPGSCHSLGPFLPFSRQLRLHFDHRFYQALVWYLSNLKLPDQPAESTRGITWLELALDFEFATGAVLPGNASRRTTKDGKRWRRGAAETVLFVHIGSTSPTQHVLERIEHANAKPRFRCSLCHRGGLWPDRHAFLKHTCAGIPETPKEAMRRHRLEAQQAKLSEQSNSNASPVPLGEKAQVFADATRSTLQKSKISAPPVLDSCTPSCRALRGFNLPISAGLTIRPILMFQDLVSDDIRRAASSFHADTWEHHSQWHFGWFPNYVFRPQPLWRPREPD